MIYTYVKSYKIFDCPSATTHTGASVTDYADQALNLLYANGHAKWMRIAQAFPPSPNQWATTAGD
jgi:hypothetical protein